MTVYEKLLLVQTELKAPKSQFNSFGKYRYRNCEDILEAAKPINAKYKATVLLTDKVIMVGERYYINVCAKFIDVETGESIEVFANAREEETKKGMDCSQVTGATSSYARKYALNGLYDIDDTKDSDTTNSGDNNGVPMKKTEAPVPAQNTAKPKAPDGPYKKALISELEKRGIDKKDFCIVNGLTSAATEEDFKRCFDMLPPQGADLSA